MPLAQHDYESIAHYLKDHISEWLPEDKLRDRSIIYELDVRERIVRVEEELKHQRELMLEMFSMTKDRFIQVDKRFEQVDKRFEQVQKQMEQRFEQVDKRFEQMQKQMEQRFEQVDKRFDHLYTFLRWQTGLGFGLFMTIIIRLFFNS